MNRNQEWWDRWYLDLARKISTASKDPNTQVGAVVVSYNNEIISTGYNRFASGVDEHPDIYADRQRKLSRVLHAEETAIVSAAGNTRGNTLYVWPMEPCSHCAAMVIHSGIIRVVSLPPPTDSKWADSFKEARAQFEEARVILNYLEMNQ